MLGFDVFILRQLDGGSAPATLASATGKAVERWSVDPWGLRWADDLAKAGEAIDLGGNGYPLRYTAQAKVLQHSRAIPLRLVKKPSLYDSPPDEWLVIDAWDQS